MQNPEEVIRKLLAMAEGGTENEAAIAAEKASMLALKYNIDLLALQEKPSDYEDGCLSEDLKVDRWVSNILSGVANLNAVKHYRNYNIATKDWVYRLVGRPHNINITRSITTYLINEVKRLNTQAVKSKPHLDNPQERGAYRKAFRHGASQRLYARLSEQLHNLKTFNQTVSALLPNANALVVADYFKTEATACDEFITKTVGALTTAKPRPISLRSNEGYRDGQKAGNKISLNTQLKGHNYGAARIAK